MAITRTGQASFGISCATDGATIHYTVDGSAPSTSSPVYSEKVTVKKNTTVKAIGVKTGYLNSEIDTEEIIVALPTPVLSQSVNGDTATITLSNASSYSGYNGVSYQISKDGGSFSTVTFPYAVSANGTYKVKAVSAGENANSAEASITLSGMKVATPVITVD